MMQQNPQNMVAPPQTLPPNTVINQKIPNPKILDINTVAASAQSQTNFVSAGQAVDALCNGMRNSEHLPHPGSITQFVTCHPLGPIVMTCPEHTTFNAALGRCDTASNRQLTTLCQTKPCQNGGVCRDLSARQFECSCPPGFTGPTCEITDVCKTNTCGPNGFCVPLQLGSPIPSYCSCFDNKAIGMTCDNTAEANPCLGPHTQDLNFPSKLSRSVYIQCEGHRAHLKFCMSPLVFSVDKQECDWDLGNKK